MSTKPSAALTVGTRLITNINLILNTNIRYTKRRDQGFSNILYKINFIFSFTVNSNPIQGLILMKDYI
jgi:hypothetical protein